MRIYISILSLLFLFSCSPNKKESNFSDQPKVVEAKGYLVPKDSMAAPKIILVDESKLETIPGVSQTVVETNSNIHVLPNKPKVFEIDKSIIRKKKPGSDTFALPEIVHAIDSPFVAVKQEVVWVKSPFVKEQNPLSFSAINKLQGLKHGHVNCILEDKSGNLWFGTNGGGVSKFDGSRLTNYTIKEGQGNNVIWQILEDKSGNLWFSSLSGGVFKYDGWHFTNYTDKNGLPGNDVRTMSMDKSGNIWFALYGGGISKFNGSYFTNFTQKQGLSSNKVTSIIVDRFDNTWFLANGNLSKYDGIEFTDYFFRECLKDGLFDYIFEDRSGNIWLSTGESGLIKFDGSFYTNFTIQDGLSSNFAKRLLEDKYGTLWIGTNGGGVNMFDGSRFVHIGENEGLNNNTVNAILEDKFGTLWFATAGGGVNKYDGSRFRHYTVKEGLRQTTVTSIFEDKSGVLWLGSYGGLTKFETNKDGRGERFTHYSDKLGLLSDNVRSILVDKAGNVWFISSGQGVIKFDGIEFKRITDKTGLPTDDVLSIFEDNFGNMWFSTYGGGVVKYEPSKNGELAKFTQYSKKEGLSDSIIWSIAQDKSGNMWFGTMYGGVTKFNGKQFTHYTEREGLSSNSINSIFEDKSGNLWFATNGGGACKYEPQKAGRSPRFIHFTEKEGLSNNFVVSILEDKSDNLWFGTRFGFSSIKKSKLDEFDNSNGTNSSLGKEIYFRNYGYEDGFFGVGVNSSKSMIMAKNGVIWFGANDRLTAFNPGGIVADTNKPNIQLTDISLFNEHIPWITVNEHKDSTFTLGNGVQLGQLRFNGLSRWYGLPEDLSLEYNNNFLTFQFVGVTQYQPKQLKYRYKLEGFDENWSSITSRTEAPYGNLPHGTYTFKVKAMNSEGIWSDEFHYRFSIRPPWWKTWWAYLIFACIIIISVFTYIKNREWSLLETKKELERKVDEATNTIRHQKDQVEEKNREILSSIEYAKRIQNAILPPHRVVSEFLKNSFILYLPKDIVAGDFYWLENSNDVVYFAACDCTGHGVPGAMVSVVCNNALNRAFNEFGERVPGKIFDKALELVLENFSKSDDEVKDGMDASLCALDIRNMKIHWAGANIPLWILRNREVIEYKANKQPIGKGQESKPFTTHEISLLQGDSIYLFTDGYADQFGGEKGKKLTKAKFREFLLKISNRPMEDQRTALLEFHEQFRGEEDQVDDICIIGVRV